MKFDPFQAGAVPNNLVGSEKINSYECHVRAHPDFGLFEPERLLKCRLNVTDQLAELLAQSLLRLHHPPHSSSVGPIHLDDSTLCCANLPEGMSLGLAFTGAAPQDIWHLTISRVQSDGKVLRRTMPITGLHWMDVFSDENADRVNDVLSRIAFRVNDVIDAETAGRVVRSMLLGGYGAGEAFRFFVLDNGWRLSRGQEDEMRQWPNEFALYMARLREAEMTAAAITAISGPVRHARL